MKKILFLSLFIMGIFISQSSFATPPYGGRWGYARYGGYAAHTGYGYYGHYGYVRPGIYYRPVPAPIVYGPAYPPVYGYYPPYYARPYYVRPFYHRHYCRRW